MGDAAGGQQNVAQQQSTLPGKPLTAQNSNPSGKPMTPLNGLPGYAIGANRPAPKYDASGIPEGFPGYTPDTTNDPFQNKPVGPAAGGAQPVLPPPPGGVRGLGSMAGRELPIPK